MTGKEKAGQEYAEALQNVTRRSERFVQILSILREMDQLDDPLKGLKSVCCRIVEAVASSLAAENCSLFLLNASKCEVQLRATCSPLEDRARYFEPDAWPAGNFKLGEGVAGAVAQTCTPLCVADSSLDTRFVAINQTSVAPRSLLCFPLMVEGRLVGVLNLSHSNPGFFTADSEHTLSFAADRAARMLANHLLHERVRLSEEYYRLILETAADAVLVFDKEGHVTSANPAVEIISGIPPQDYVSNQVTWQSRVHPDDRGLFQQHLEQLLTEKQPAGVQYRCIDIRDTVHALEQRGCPLFDSQGEVQGVVCIARDVSERKLAEEELLQAQKMECVGRLAGGIAHDFNNLLTIISGYGEVLHAHLEGMPEALGRLHYIEEAAERAGQLVKQLLAFSRKQVLQPKVIDLNLSLQETTKMLRRVMGDDVQLVTDSCEDPARILIDPVHLTQVLMNLAVNARDAMEAGGMLKIETAVAEVGEEFAGRPESCPPGRYARIAVQDTGCGMSQETRARIFEPFFTTKLNGAGTGLGLPTVRGIVGQNGGFITVESELGRGSTFSAYFPLVKEKAETAAAPASTAALRGSETVLVVEDERAVRQLIVQMLTRQGFNVLEAPSAEAAAALEKDHAEPIHLLLADFLMPHMNGHQLALQLCRNRPQLKVLIMSGYAGHSIADHALRESGYGLVQKPFTSPELIRRIREILDAP
ncbi:MAG: response regulator [Candidatus Hydrogenedentes bacterium]|nr:response regulator [Candidatus Hydrogenedentota bacterium]